MIHNIDKYINVLNKLTIVKKTNKKSLTSKIKCLLKVLKRYV